MMKNYWLFIGIMLTVLLVGCSNVPTDEEIKDAVADKVQVEVNKAVGHAVDKVKEDGKQAANDLLQKGSSKLNELLGASTSTDSTNKTNESSKVIQTSGTTEQYKMEYISNYDGDTYTLKFLEGPNKGEKVKVRALLIDSPELKKGKKGKPQPFSTEAQVRAEELLKSGVVTLEYDIGERQDPYSRTLAYVRINGQHIATTLLNEGLARVAYVFPPNTRYLDEFKEAEAIAKEKGIAVWSIENYSTDFGFNNIGGN